MRDARESGRSRASGKPGTRLSKLTALGSIAAAALGFTIVAACSSSTVVKQGSTGDGGQSEDSGSVSQDSGAVDAGVDAGPVNACTTYSDHTAAADPRTIPWGFSLSGSTARCMKINAGQTVTWQGDFSTYPVSASGGDKGNPIANFNSTTGAVTFPTKGTFGYDCTSAPALLGAIEVE